MRLHALLAQVVVLLLAATAPLSAAPPPPAAPKPAVGMAPTAVSGFTPTSGRAGTAVTVNGTGFLASDQILVDGKPATAPTITDSSIAFTVPAGARKGVLALRRRGAKDIAIGIFAVLPEARITALQPAKGPVGTEVSVLGTGFLPGDAVQLGDKPVTPTSTTADHIVFVVPPGAESDVVSVGGVRSRQRFEVVLPPPSVGSFSPDTGPPGTKVTIQGTSFTRDERAFLGATPLEIGARSETSLEVTIPPHANRSAPLSVKGPRGASTSTQIFRVVLPPIVRKLEPMAGPPGSRVDLVGEHFLPGDQVKHGDVSLRIVDYDEQRLGVELDRDATSAPFEIFRAGQKVATSPQPFEVVRTPVVTGFTPTSGLAGTRVTLTGTYFTPELQVRYGKQPVRILERSGTTAVVVEVPHVEDDQPFTVETHGGVAATATSFDVFRYSSVTRLTPAAGRPGSRVTVSGAGFDGSDRFFLGDVALPVLERRPDACVVLVPSAAPSGVLTWESHGKRQSSRLAFTVKRPPSVASFAPTSGPWGSEVTLTGTDFSAEVTCRFGQLPCKIVRRKLPTEITVEIPKGAAGSDYLWLESDGKRFKATPSFQVIEPPAVTSVVPSTASAGTEVTLGGANFTATTTVQLDKTPLEIEKRQLPGVLVVTVPPLPPGTYTITVADGTSKTKAPTKLTVVAVPRVTSVAPLSGTAATEVTLVGENFGARVLVWFGSAACTILRREGKTKLVVKLPPGTTGNDTFTVVDGGKKATSMQVFEAR
jgi:hypothetical protein